MFWRKNSSKDEEKEEKSSGPKEIPGIVQEYLVTEKKMGRDLVKLLRAVLRKGIAGESVSHIRIFDESEAIAKQVMVRDYTSLNESPELILYEGSFDERAKQVKLEDKKRVHWDIPIFTQTEIQQKIDSLQQPGDMVFFYMGRGSCHGGPLGMGAAVIELNPGYPGRKQKKYIAYRADVVDMQPIDKGQKVFDSDKPKDIARWVKDGHHKRIY